MAAIAGALQLGIAHSVGKLSERPDRDVLMQDFEVVELIDFPTKGTTLTPPHEFGEFTFQVPSIYSKRSEAKKENEDKCAKQSFASSILTTF